MWKRIIKFFTTKKFRRERIRRKLNNTYVIVTHKKKKAIKVEKLYMKAGFHWILHNRPGMPRWYHPSKPYLGTCGWTLDYSRFAHSYCKKITIRRLKQLTDWI